MTRVLIGLDSSPQSAHAGRVAHRLFGDSAEYLAISVASDPAIAVGPGRPWGSVYPWYGGGPDIVSEDPEQVRARAESTAAEAAARAQVPAAATVGEVGDPVAGILAAAEEHAVDVIVVGSEGKGWWGRLLDGSVSESLVRKADTPVLVVKEAEDADGGEGVAVEGVGAARGFGDS
ncbi:MAG: hypothetical protein GEV08_21385 [Acidimicrobiia bacterium]|nr:hypothetical protein [Acidimicrobiia bacterium]